MVLVRKAKPSDASAVQKLLRETWLDTYGNYLSQATLDEVYRNWQNVEFLTRQIENPDFYFPVAVENEAVLGIATARSSEGMIVMFRLYVHPDHQRKGIGERLLGEVIQHFLDKEKVQLHVEVLNQKGQSFYKKHGFKELKREEEKVVNEVIEQILMEKELG